MSRYIDAERFRKEITVDKYGHIETTITKLNIAIEHSTVDAVKVVRCKDCKYRNGETKGCVRNPCVEPWQKNDFCSYGER